MRKGRDPLDILRASNPVPEEEAPSPETPRAKALLERIIRMPEPSPRRKAGRSRLWILVPVALVAVAAGSYAWVRDVREPQEVACYAKANLTADRAIVPATGGDPTTACAALWRPGGQFNPSGQASPILAACVLRSGTVGVFPGLESGDTCAALGLARPGSSPRDTAAIKRLTDDLGKAFTTCIPQADAVGLATTEISKQGLDGWRVVANIPFSAQSPCASLYVDIDHRTVNIVPSSNPGSP